MKTGVADSTRRVLGRSLALQTAPQPPRGGKFASGVVSWEAPQTETGLTHYNVYAADGTTLVRRVPAGQLRIQDNLTAAQLFVKSYNQFADLESAPVLIPGPIAPITPSLSVDDGYELVTVDMSGNATPDIGMGVNHLINLTIASTTINYPINSLGVIKRGQRVNIRVQQDSTGGRLIRWNIGYEGIGHTGEYDIPSDPFSWSRFEFVVRQDGMRLELANKPVFIVL